MLKFWKKKPDDQKAPSPPAKAAVDPSVPESVQPSLHEALAEVPAPADTQPERERFVVPADERVAPARRSWRERLSGSALSRSLGSLFVRHPKLDDDLLDELETALISADVGIEASTGLVENLRKRVHQREFADAQALLAALRQALVALLKPVEQPLQVDAGKPFVVLVVGVNGAGKTTTIGKLARRWRDEGRMVMLAAGDTFRAAAVEQLKTWGARNQVPVVSQGQDADAASVIFDALQEPRSRGIDVLIADTAGRLHTQGGLMDELGKIARVLKKLDAGAPHEVLMVIDGTTGQNAVNQVRQFRLPIRYVGLGETATDLRSFEVEAFVDALLPHSLGHGQDHD